MTAKGFRTGTLTILAIAAIFISAAPGVSARPSSYDDLGCTWDGCPPLSTEQFARSMASLGNAKGLHIEMFYMASVFSPVERPIGSVEAGARCVLTAQSDVDDVVAIMSKLKQTPDGFRDLTPTLEIRFFRADQLVLRTFFTDGGTRDAHDAVISAAMIDGRVGSFYVEPVGELLRFAEDRMIGPSAGKACTVFEPF